MNTCIFINCVKLTPYRYSGVHDYLIELLDKNKKSCLITYLNAYVYCLAKRNKELNATISNAEVVLADGISIVWASLLINRIRIHRCIMTKVFDDFLISPDLRKSKGILIGATESEVKVAQKKMNTISPKINIVAAFSGYQENHYYSEVFQKYNDIDMVLIGMGSPKSEYLCNLALKICVNALIWHIGGGTINCYAGTKRRAPEWISKLGVEWLQRFVFEKHTRKRYIIYNIVFLFFMTGGCIKSLCQLLKKKIKALAFT